MRNIFNIIVLAGLSLMATSCFDKANPNYQFFPNMYESVGYETYSEHSVFKGGKEGQLPPTGTIKRGFEVYDIPNTPEGYAAAKAGLKNPLSTEEKDLEKGKELFNIYCAICHGEAGDGKGNLAKREKFAGVPNYKDREITEGSIFHVVTYGINAMGSHANQLSKKERWQVADYVLKLKSELK